MSADHQQAISFRFWMSWLIIVPILGNALLHGTPPHLKRTSSHALVPVF
jgi:hypothetical protein